MTGMTSEDIGMGNQWNDLLVQLAQLYDLHYCMVDPHILKTSLTMTRDDWDD